MRRGKSEQEELALSLMSDGFPPWRVRNGTTGGTYACVRSVLHKDKSLAFWQKYGGIGFWNGLPRGRL